MIFIAHEGVQIWANHTEDSVHEFMRGSEGDFQRVKVDRVNITKEMIPDSVFLENNPSTNWDSGKPVEEYRAFLSVKGFSFVFINENVANIYFKEFVDILGETEIFNEKHAEVMM